MKKNIVIISVIVLLLVGISIFIARPKKIRRPAPAPKGKIAIVLDDWGNNMADFRLVEEIKYPLTLAILPNIRYSHMAAQELHSMGFEIILHLPMEPRERYGLEKNTIMVSSTNEQIAGILAQDLANVVYAKGVSNHMGSRATSDLKTMEFIFMELKKRHLYFLDSFVSPQSICLELAHKLKLKLFRRDVFLDNKQERGYIKKQIYQLKDKARLNGFAIGIGHDRKVTLEVLKEVMPKIDKEGYKFVFLSEL